MTDKQEKSMPLDPQPIRLGEVFTPAVPIREVGLFSGRSDLLLRIADVVNQRGMHCVLFGERGAGKMSLANILPIVVESVGASLASANINCDTTDAGNQYQYIADH